MKIVVPETNRLKIGFILARSFTLSAFALFVDTLRLASDEADRERLQRLAIWAYPGGGASAAAHSAA